MVEMIPTTSRFGPGGKLARVQSTIGYGRRDVDPSVTERDRFPQVFSAGISTPINKLSLIWSVARQVHAIDMGFFFHRTYPDNHVTVIPKRLFKTARDVLNHLEKLDFNGDTFARSALMFLKQQDEYGFRNAWDPVVRNHTHAMLWYKRLRRRAETDVGIRRYLHGARTQPRPSSEAPKPLSKKEKAAILKLEIVEREWAGLRPLKEIKASIQRTETELSEVQALEDRALVVLDNARSRQKLLEADLAKYYEEIKSARALSV